MAKKPKEPQETKLGGSLNLVLQGQYGGLPIRLTFDEGTTEAVRTLLKNLGGGRNLETKVFACKGADGKLHEVQVLASVGDDYLQIRCPRLQEELEYVRKGFDGTLNYHTPCCYEGEDLQNVPVVEEKEFAANKIFKCPYASAYPK